LQNGVLWSYDTALINADRKTVASVFKNSGYQTACIGKWHLGLGWQKNAYNQIDFSKPVTTGPNTVGFDYSYIIGASLDLPPYVFIQNHQLTAPIIDTIKETKVPGFWREGPIGKGLQHKNVLTDLTQKAVEYIQDQKNSKAPFFLYLPLTAPHTPILPTAGFEGKSGINAYADFVLMTDAMVGKIVDAIKEAGMLENTLIVFTSDNGASPSADFKTLIAAGHDASAGFRGAKADIFEGGHRIPFVINWPGVVESNTISDKTVSLTDFYATVANVLGKKIQGNEAEDSYSLMPLLLNNASGYQRQNIIHHSIEGKFAIRSGDYKLIFARGSGGWSAPTEAAANKLNLPAIQLYNLRTDPKEQHNIAAENPQIVTEFKALLEKQIVEGRSTPGKRQNNDVLVNF
jgi:arylsulfatase A-like enzyme